MEVGKAPIVTACKAVQWDYRVFWGGRVSRVACMSVTFTIAKLDLW